MEGTSRPATLVAGRRVGRARHGSKGVKTTESYLILKETAARPMHAAPMQC